MQYFGVPTCPYCKKRVNLIRTWSLKRQGEYRCPRCGGISNIYLSPLVYVFALVAVFAGVAIYFFHKFILDDITLTTGIQVIIPFAVFFLLSLFMVYLAKPVIKKVPRAQVDRKRRNKGNFEERRMPAGRQGQTGQIFYDGEDYQPHTNYRAGPMPQEQGDAAGADVFFDLASRSQPHIRQILVKSYLHADCHRHPGRYLFFSICRASFPNPSG